MEDAIERENGTADWEEIAAAGRARRALTLNIHGSLIVLLRDGVAVPPPEDEEERRGYHGLRRRAGCGWRNLSADEHAEIADGGIADTVLAMPGMLRGMLAAAARAKGQDDHRLRMTDEERAFFAFPWAVGSWRCHQPSGRVRGALPVFEAARGELLRAQAGGWPQKDYGTKYNIGVVRPEAHFYLHMATLGLHQLVDVLTGK
jgi:hypothetical protein